MAEEQFKEDAYFIIEQAGDLVRFAVYMEESHTQLLAVKVKPEIARVLAEKFTYTSWKCEGYNVVGMDDGEGRSG